MRNTFISLLGMVLGIAAVRFFVLQDIEILGWKMFWEAFFDFEISLKDLVTDLPRSHTFWKSVAGGVCGLMLGRLFSSKITDYNN